MADDMNYRRAIEAADMLENVSAMLFLLQLISSRTHGDVMNVLYYRKKEANMLYEAQLMSEVVELWNE